MAFSEKSLRGKRAMRRRGSRLRGGYRSRGKERAPGGACGGQRRLPRLPQLPAGGDLRPKELRRVCQRRPQRGDRVHLSPEKPPPRCRPLLPARPVSTPASRPRRQLSPREPGRKDVDGSFEVIINSRAHRGGGKGAR